MLYTTRSYPDVITRLSFASAYPALVLLAGNRLAISLDFWRYIGIWAGILALLHVAIGQCVHLRGRPWLYYIYENWQAKHALPCDTIYLGSPITQDLSRA
ncbi:MAG: hypothetical protein ABJA60_01970 [Nitrosospira sp.]